MNNDADAPRDDLIVASSLFRNAIVSFVACFDKSVTPRLDVDSVYSEAEGGIEYFKWLKDLRDSWVAHRFGAHRQSYVGPMVDDNTGKYIGIGNMVQMYAAPKTDGADQLVSFMKAAEHAAKVIAKPLHGELDKYMQEMPETVLLRLPTALSKAAGTNDLRMGRRKYRSTIPLQRPKPDDDQ